MSQNNQPPNFLQRWKKVDFVCWLNITFCVKKTLSETNLSSINIIRTWLRRMEWLRTVLPNFFVYKHRNHTKFRSFKWDHYTRNDQFDWCESESAWDNWDRIHLNWACGQYFAYRFGHKKAVCKMGAAIPHNRPKTHLCNHFAEKFGLF